MSAVLTPLAGSANWLCRSTTSTPKATLQHILNKHQNVFKGIGSHKYRQVKLLIDKTVDPIIQPQWKIPFAKCFQLYKRGIPQRDKVNTGRHTKHWKHLWQHINQWNRTQSYAVSSPTTSGWLWTHFKLTQCNLNKPRINFFGVIFSHKGLVPAPKNIQVLLRAPQPQSVAEPCSFLDMVNSTKKNGTSQRRMPPFNGTRMLKNQSTTYCIH